MHTNDMCVWMGGGGWCLLYYSYGGKTFHRFIELAVSSPPAIMWYENFHCCSFYSFIAPLLLGVSFTRLCYSPNRICGRCPSSNSLQSIFHSDFCFRMNCTCSLWFWHHFQAPPAALMYHVRFRTHFGHHS